MYCCRGTEEEGEAESVRKGEGWIVGDTYSTHWYQLSEGMHMGGSEGGE
jgi:hypothetical protein